MTIVGRLKYLNPGMQAAYQTFYKFTFMLIITKTEETAEMSVNIMNVKPTISIVLLCAIDVLQQRAVLLPDNDWSWFTVSVTLDGIRHARVDGDSTAKFLCEHRL